MPIHQEEQRAIVRASSGVKQGSCQGEMEHSYFSFLAVRAIAIYCRFAPTSQFLAACSHLRNLLSSDLENVCKEK
jgi:hypothetical protein